MHRIRVSTSVAAFIAPRLNAELSALITIIATISESSTNRIRSRNTSDSRTNDERREEHDNTRKKLVVLYPSRLHRAGSHYSGLLHPLSTDPVH